MTWCECEYGGSVVRVWCECGVSMVRVRCECGVGVNVSCVVRDIVLSYVLLSLFFVVSSCQCVVSWHVWYGVVLGIFTSPSLQEEILELWATVLCNR